MAVDKEKGNFITEDELEQEIAAGRMQQVDRTVNPNVPGLPVGGPPPAHGVDPYGSGPLPPNFGYQPALVKTGYSANTGPIGLLPIYQSPLVGSAIKSHTQPIAATANAANETANSAQTTATTANASAKVSAATLATPALSAIGASGEVDTTQPYVAATIGAFPSTVVGTTASILSYTSTTTSITFTWSSFMILFSDGTTETVASGSQAITGLSATQTYYAYPVVLGTALTLTFIAVAGGVGSPAILYQPQNPQAAQQQNLQSNTAMSNGGIACVTPSSGSGGGHGGGSGICLRSGQYVESKSRGVIAIEDVEVSELIRGRQNWTEVVCKKVLPQNHFVRGTASNGDHISFTPTHLTTAIRDGVEISIPAGKLTVSDFLILRDGYASITTIEHVEEESEKVQLSCEPEHEFFCSESKAASILVHNVQPISIFILLLLSTFLFAHHIA